MTEGGFKDTIDRVCERLDPNAVYKFMIDMLKRLYIKTRYNSPSEVRKYEAYLRSGGFLKEKKSKMIHYRKKEFGGKLDDTVPLASEHANVTCDHFDYSVSNNNMKSK